VDQRTRENVAAAEAVGAEYWAESHLPGHVWAVKGGVYVLVRVNRSAGLAWIAGQWTGAVDGEMTLAEESQAVPFTTMVAEASL
jgi:hypothetical protein